MNNTAGLRPPLGKGNKMPHTKSAKKSQRQDQKRRDRNRAVKKLDKAAARRVIHPNAAARKKSQLARQLAAPAKA